MQVLQNNDLVKIQGAGYMSSMFEALSDGLNDSERALLMTGLSAGFVGGALLGRFGLIIGAVTMVGYYAYDRIKYNASEEDQPT